MIILKDSNITVCDAPSVVSILQSWLNEQDEVERDKEHGIILVFNVRQRLLLVELVSVGSLEATILHPREVFRRAIACGGASIILSHNHPTGECSPSHEDDTVTQRIREAGRIIGIDLIDHIIFSPTGFYSFVEQGRL